MNAWALGGVSAFVRDLRFQMVERATNQAVRVAYDQGIGLTLIGRVERSFTLLLFPIAAFWALYLTLRRRVALPGDEGSATVNPVLILLAALPFLALFTELWVGQYYPTLLVLPLNAVGCAVLAFMMIGARRAVWRPVGFVLVAALAANSIAENMRFKKAFLPRSEIASLKKALDAVTVPGQRILVDHVFDAAYRYYFNHNTVALILESALALRRRAPVLRGPEAAGGRPAQRRGVRAAQAPCRSALRQGLLLRPRPRRALGPVGNPERYHDEIDGFIAMRDSDSSRDGRGDGRAEDSGDRHVRPSGGSCRVRPRT